MYFNIYFSDIIFIKTTDTKIAGVNVRIFEPSVKLGKKSNMVMVFYHGGGFVIGNTGSFNEK